MRTYGSVRGAARNGRPYRDSNPRPPGLPLICRPAFTDFGGALGIDGAFRSPPATAYWITLSDSHRQVNENFAVGGADWYDSSPHLLDRRKELS